MKVIGVTRLQEFCDKHSDARGQLWAWLAEAEAAVWKTPSDIKQKFGSASILAGNIVVFNIKGNTYRLVIKVAYNTGIVKIERLGTHAEYSRWTL